MTDQIRPQAIGTLSYDDSLQPTPYAGADEKNGHAEPDSASSTHKQEAEQRAQQPIAQDDGVTRIEALCELFYGSTADL